MLKVIKALDKFLLKLEEFILSYAVLIIAFMIIGNVVSRIVTGESWAFTQEVSRFSVFLATFMGIGYAARKGRHISMSAFFDLAPPKVKKILAIFIPSVTALTLFVFTYYSYVYVMNVRGSGRVTSALQLPEWLMISFVPVGLLLGGLQFVRNAWVNIKEEEVYIGTEKQDYT